MNDDDRLRFFEQAGIAALIPGLTDAIEALQRKRSELLERLALLQNGGAVKAKRGRPLGSANSYWTNMTPEERSAEMRRRGAHRKDRVSPVANAQAAYWARMTPEERKAEMKRRVAKQARMQGKRKNLGGGANHPRNPNHPGHEAWLKKIRQTSKASWTKLTPERRAERQAKMRRAA